MEATGPNDIRDGLLKAGATHLVVREDLLQEYLATGIPHEKRLTWYRYLESRGRKLFESRGYTVYQVDL